MTQPALWNQLKRGEKGQFRYRLSHGGVRKPGKRKTARPFIPGRWMHVVLKSAKARGALSLLSPRHRRMVEETVSSQAKNCGGTLREQVNMGNHLHIKIRFRERGKMRRFLRVVPGLIARRVLKAEKAHPKGRFWDSLAFSRVLTSSLQAYRLKWYFRANRDERDFGATVRKETLAGLNHWIRALAKKSAGLPLPRHSSA